MNTRESIQTRCKSTCSYALMPDVIIRKIQFLDYSIHYMLTYCTCLQYLAGHV